MYELEREEHIVTHGQLEEVPRATFEVEFLFTFSPQALLNAERLEEDLRRSHSQLAEAFYP